MGLYKHSDGCNYREMPLRLPKLSFIPKKDRPSWRGYFADAYNPMVKEEIRDTIGDIDLGIEGLVPEELTMHPRFWCGRSLLPFHKLSANVKALLSARWSREEERIFYREALVKALVTQLARFRTLGQEERLTQSQIRKLMSNCTYLLRRIISIQARVNVAKLKYRIESMSEKWEDLRRSWRVIENAVERGEFYGTPPTAQKFWYEARKELKPIIFVQYKLNALGSKLSQRAREMFSSYYDECPAIPSEFDEHDPSHKGIALIDVDVIQ